jgi:hypothetical protein
VKHRLLCNVQLPCLAMPRHDAEERTIQTLRKLHSMTIFRSQSSASSMVIPTTHHSTVDHSVDVPELGTVVGEGSDEGPGR